MALTGDLLVEFILCLVVRANQQLVEHIHCLIDGIAVTLPEKADQRRRRGAAISRSRATDDFRT
jgi:hypothetical protein